MSHRFLQHVGWLLALVISLFVTWVSLIDFDYFLSRTAFLDDVPITYALVSHSPEAFQHDVFSYFYVTGLYGSILNSGTALLSYVADPYTITFGLSALLVLSIGLSSYWMLLSLTQNQGIALLGMAFFYAVHPWRWNLSNYEGPFPLIYAANTAFVCAMVTFGLVVRGQRWAALAVMLLTGLIHPSIGMYTCGMVGLYWLAGRKKENFRFLLLLGGVIGIITVPALVATAGLEHRIPDDLMLQTLIRSHHLNPFTHWPEDWYYTSSAIELIGWVLLSSRFWPSLPRPTLSLWGSVTLGTLILMAGHWIGVQLEIAQLIQSAGARATALWVFVSLALVFYYFWQHMFTGLGAVLVVLTVFLMGVEQNTVRWMLPAFLLLDLSQGQFFIKKIALPRVGRFVMQAAALGIALAAGWEIYGKTPSFAANNFLWDIPKTVIRREALTVGLLAAVIAALTPRPRVRVPLLRGEKERKSQHPAEAWRYFSVLTPRLPLRLWAGIAHSVRLSLPLHGRFNLMYLPVAALMGGLLLVTVSHTETQRKNVSEAWIVDMNAAQNWARENTPPDAMFLGLDATWRAVARRPYFYFEPSWSWYVYLPDQRLLDNQERIRAWYDVTRDTQTLLFIDHLFYHFSSQEWLSIRDAEHVDYLIRRRELPVTAWDGRLNFEIAYENDSFQIYDLHRPTSPLLTELDYALQAEWSGRLDDHSGFMLDASAGFNSVRPHMVMGYTPEVHRRRELFVPLALYEQNYMTAIWQYKNPAALLNELRIRYVYVDENWVAPESARRALQNNSQFEEIFYVESGGSVRGLYRVLPVSLPDYYPETFAYRDIILRVLNMQLYDDWPSLELEKDAVVLLPRDNLGLGLDTILPEVRLPEAFDADAIQAWQLNKLPDSLREVGIDYLLVDHLWAQYLTESESAALNDPTYYELVREWRIGNLREPFYRLYRIKDRTPEQK